MGSWDVFSAVCYTIYTIYLSLCTQSAETTSPEPFSWIPPDLELIRPKGDYTGLDSSGSKGNQEETNQGDRSLQKQMVTENINNVSGTKNMPIKKMFNQIFLFIIQISNDKIIFCHNNFPFIPSVCLF